MAAPPPLPPGSCGPNATTGELPAQTLTCVEFPGFVANISRALESLAALGDKKVRRVVSRRVVSRRRPRPADVVSSPRRVMRTHRCCHCDCAPKTPSTIRRLATAFERLRCCWSLFGGVVSVHARARYRSQQEMMALVVMVTVLLVTRSRPRSVRQQRQATRWWLPSRLPSTRVPSTHSSMRPIDSKASHLSS